MTTTLGDEITTRVSKDFYGKWNAKSTIALPQLPAEHRLRLHTYMAKGRVVCMASVHCIKDGFETHRVFTDYSQCVYEDRTVTRGTESAIRLAHANAIADVDKIVESVVAHYAQMDAKQANLDAAKAYNNAYAASLAQAG